MPGQHAIGCNNHASRNLLCVAPGLPVSVFLQLQDRVVAVASELHAVQMAVSGARATAAEGSSSGQHLRQQLASMQEQLARYGTIGCGVTHVYTLSL